MLFHVKFTLFSQVLQKSLLEFVQNYKNFQINLKRMNIFMCHGIHNHYISSHFEESSLMPLIRYFFLHKDNIDIFLRKL